MVIMEFIQSYNVAQAKTHLSEILEQVEEGEEIVLTRRGKPVARVVPGGRTGMSILGAGTQDPNIDPRVLASDNWWKPLSQNEAQVWYD